MALYIRKHCTKFHKDISIQSEKKIDFTGWDFNAKPASVLINGGNIMFKMGLTVFLITFIVLILSNKNTCQANKLHKKAIYQISIRYIDLVLLEKLPPF